MCAVRAAAWLLCLGFILDCICLCLYTMMCSGGPQGKLSRCLVEVWWVCWKVTVPACRGSAPVCSSL